jgi:hypothetical protein
VARAKPLVELCRPCVTYLAARDTQGVDYSSRPRETLKHGASVPGARAGQDLLFKTSSFQGGTTPKTYTGPSQRVKPKQGSSILGA